jgi:hypothetical protein
MFRLARTSMSRQASPSFPAPPAHSSNQRLGLPLPALSSLQPSSTRNLHGLHHFLCQFAAVSSCQLGLEQCRMLSLDHVQDKSLSGSHVSPARQLARPARGMQGNLRSGPANGCRHIEIPCNELPFASWPAGVPPGSMPVVWPMRAAGACAARIFNNG